MIIPKEVNTTSKDIKGRKLKDLNATNDITKINNAEQYFLNIYGISE